MTYVNTREAVRQLGLHPSTLRRYANDGTIETIRTPGNRRLYNIDGYLKKSAGCTTICYCRVSSRKQADDLERQVERMRAIYPKAEIVTDIGSGLNFKRKGLRSLLERLLRGDKLKVVVANRDRIARFGFDLFKFIIEQNGGELLELGARSAQRLSEIC